MERTIFKLKIWLIDPYEKGEFRDFYFDVSRINGFYIPDKEDEFDAINLFVDGDFISVKQEPHIKKWLLDNFVDKIDVLNIN